MFCAQKPPSAFKFHNEYQRKSKKQEKSKKQKTRKSLFASATHLRTEMGPYYNLVHLVPLLRLLD